MTPPNAPTATGEECAECGHTREYHRLGALRWCAVALCGCARFRPATAAEREGEELARQFHEAYERLAPSFGYETRKASAKPWAEVPEQNKRLMVAVCAELLSSSPFLAARRENERMREIVRRVVAWDDAYQMGITTTSVADIIDDARAALAAADPETR